MGIVVVHGGTPGAADSLKQAGEAFAQADQRRFQQDVVAERLKQGWDELEQEKRKIDLQEEFQRFREGATEIQQHQRQSFAQSLFPSVTEQGVDLAPWAGDFTFPGRYLDEGHARAFTNLSPEDQVAAYGVLRGQAQEAYGAARAKFMTDWAQRLEASGMLPQGYSERYTEDLSGGPQQGNGKAKKRDEVQGYTGNVENDARAYQKQLQLEQTRTFVREQLATLSATVLAEDDDWKKNEAIGEIMLKVESAETPEEIRGLYHQASWYANGSIETAVKLEQEAFQKGIRSGLEQASLRPRLNRSAIDDERWKSAIDDVVSMSEMGMAEHLPQYFSAFDEYTARMLYKAATQKLEQRKGAAGQKRKQEQSLEGSKVRDFFQNAGDTFKVFNYLLGKKPRSAEEEEGMAKERNKEIDQSLLERGGNPADSWSQKFKEAKGRDPVSKKELYAWVREQIRKGEF